MGWRVELDQAAERDLDRLDPQTARRILVFLHGRIAALDDPPRSYTASAISTMPERQRRPVTMRWKSTGSIRR